MLWKTLGSGAQSSVARAACRPDDGRPPSGGSLEGSAELTHAPTEPWRPRTPIAGSWAQRVRRQDKVLQGRHYVHERFRDQEDELYGLLFENHVNGSTVDASFAKFARAARLLQMLMLFPRTRHI